MTANRKSRQKRKLDAIAALGGHCARCREDDTIVLQFDHIVPRHRTGEVKLNGQHNFNRINRMVKQGQDPGTVYQLLCANCHVRKGHENRDHVRGAD